jgi:hypothetical protein
MNTPEPTKVYVVLSVIDLRRMIKSIKARSKPHTAGGYGPCTGVFRSTISNDLNTSGEHQIRSYEFSHREES